MGITCSAVTCVGSYFCCSPDEYQGNIIFKSINTNLILEDDNFTEEEKKILEKCENILKKSEEERLKIAEKFQDVLENTGACILRQPTLERAIISFIIYLFEQIILCAKKNNVVFDKNDFALTNFVSVSKSSPFVKFNQENLDKLKTKYGFDINSIEELSKSQKSLTTFLATVVDTQNVVSKQYELVKGLLTDMGKNFKLVKKISDSLEGIKFIFNYFSELTSSLYSAQKQLASPKKMELFFKIAQNAAEKQIKDPKEMVMIYSWGENCGSIDKWKENMVYKKVVIYKY